MITDLMLKITNYCNLNCKYCYLEKRSDERIDRKTIDNIVNFLNYNLKITYGQPINIYVSGGEVTTLPIEDIEYLYAGLYHPNYVNLSMNTNSFAFTDEHAKLLKKYNISASLSLDGDKFIHDLRRSNSFNKTVQNITRLNKNNIRWGCVTVIDDYSTQHIDEIYNFFRDYHINTKMNPAVGYVNPDSWADAMIRVYERLMKDNFPFTEDTICDLLSVKNRQRCHTNACNFGDCFKTFLSIDYNGNITPCERFFGIIDENKNQNLIIGNINSDSPIDIISNQKRTILLHKLYQRKDKCLNCEYFNYCGSGCSHDSLLNCGGIENKDSFCEAKKKLIKRILAI